MRERLVRLKHHQLGPFEDKKVQFTDAAAAGALTACRAITGLEFKDKYLLPPGRF